uniref:Uncharacterized protein n=1 Tax=viral metagenome TaxID=1070528 RepID=A0A6C0LRA6_9ZZZZ
MTNNNLIIIDEIISTHEKQYENDLTKFDAIDINIMDKPLEKLNNDIVLELKNMNEILTNENNNLKAINDTLKSDNVSLNMKCNSLIMFRKILDTLSGEYTELKNINETLMKENIILNKIIVDKDKVLDYYTI